MHETLGRAAVLVMKFYESLARGLVDHNVDTIFGLLADPTMLFARSFVEDFGGNFVSAAHEAGAAHMAYGYGAVSGRVGVVSVDHGPGLTNSLTALIDAVKARAPMLFLYPDTVVADKNYRQNILQREIILASGAGLEQVRSPQTLHIDLAVALRRAVAECRPIALHIPREFINLEIEYQHLNLARTPSLAASFDDAQLDRAVGLIASARRPVVLAGRGAIAARTELIALANRLGAPLATSLGAKDLFRGEPFDIGIMGTLSSGPAIEVLAAADCIVAFGAGLNDDTTARGGLLAGKRVVQCDVDPARLDNYASVDSTVLGDAALVAATMVDWIEAAELSPTEFSTPELAERIAAHWAAPPPPVDGPIPETVDVRGALAQLDAAVPSNRIYVNDPGRHSVVSWPSVRVQSPRDFVLTAHFGAIGTGLPVAIGAGIADRTRPVFMVGGDAAFMLGGLNEFNTAVRQGVDLIAVICNDGAYGPEHQMLVQWGYSPAIVEFDWPDLGPVATALGGSGITVRNEADVARACEMIRTRTTPVLVDLKLDAYHMPSLDH